MCHLIDTVWTEPVCFSVSSDKTKAKSCKVIFLSFWLSVFDIGAGLSQLGPRCSIFVVLKDWVLLRESNHMPSVTLLILYRSLNVVFMIGCMLFYIKLWKYHLSLLIVLIEGISLEPSKRSRSTHQ